MDNGQDFLLDVNKHGKPIEWKKRKENNINVSDSFERLYNKYSATRTDDKLLIKKINNFEKKNIKLKECGTYLEYKVFTKTSLKKLHKANFCKVRLCPLCAWRRSLKIFGQVSQVMNIAKLENKCSFIFLTLTVKNCSGDELSSTLDILFKSFKRFMERKSIKRVALGWFRALEVTYNKESNTFHPHFHLLIMVKNYYDKNKNLYIDHHEYVKLWRESLRVDYDPIVYVGAVRAKKGKGIESVVAEVAKYTVKEDDLILKDSDGVYNLEQSDINIEILDKALAFRRLTAFGGILKEIHKLLELDDPDNGDLVNTENQEELNEDLEYIIEKYFWHIGYSNYVKVEEPAL